MYPNMAELISGNSPESDNGRVELTTSELGSFHGFLTNRRAYMLHTVLAAFVSVEYEGICRKIMVASTL